MRRKVAILLFDDVEVLDFAGPFEVFAVADELHGHDCFEVFTVAADGAETVRARNGLSVTADYRLGEAPTPQLLVVPGGQGTRALLEVPPFLQWLWETAHRCERVLSVCTGALLLARAGLLEGLTATTHHSALDLLADLAPRTGVVHGRRFVDNGRVVTAAGISAGIDMSLHVVGQLLGREAAVRTAEYMEYRWDGSL